MNNAYRVTFLGSRHLVFLFPFIIVVEGKEAGWRAMVCQDAWNCGHIPEFVKKIKSCQENVHELP